LTTSAFVSMQYHGVTDRRTEGRICHNIIALCMHRHVDARQKKPFFVVCNVPVLPCRYSIYDGWKDMELEHTARSKRPTSRPGKPRAGQAGFTKSQLIAIIMGLGANTIRLYFLYFSRARLSLLQTAVYMHRENDISPPDQSPTDKSPPPRTEAPPPEWCMLYVESSNSYHKNFPVYV